MSNLAFCLNATIPVFLLMVLGYAFLKTGIISENFAKSMNSFVFRVALPVLVFQDLANNDFREFWDGRYVFFCFLASFISILAAVLLSLCLKDKGIRGEFIQGSYRSSAALLGIGFIQNIYGNALMAPLMIIGAVPLYNAAAVVVLTLFHKQEALSEERQKDAGIRKMLFRNTFVGIIKNPIIIGIILGVIWSVLRIPQPVIMSKTLKYLANVATPMGLMALGASFDIKKAKSALSPAILASVIKLIVFTAVFLPIAIKMGFTHDKLVAILIMLGSPTTVSSFVMAKNMGHDGALSANIVMITTLACAFTLTLWLYVLRYMGLV